MKNKHIAVSEARSTDRVSFGGALIQVDDFDWTVRYGKLSIDNFEIETFISSEWEIWMCSSQTWWRETLDSQFRD